MFDSRDVVVVPKQAAFQEVYRLLKQASGLTKLLFRAWLVVEIMFLPLQNLELCMYASPLQLRKHDVGLPEQYSSVGGAVNQERRRKVRVDVELRE